MYELLVFLVIAAAIWNAVVLYARMTAWVVSRSKQVSRLIEQANAACESSNRVKP